MPCASCVAAAAAVTPFGGHLAQYLGDGLLIYFGWPNAREDDPERAIRAALAILDAMVPLNATFAEGDATRLAVRIGLHTRPVVIAGGGLAFGDTANIAIRLCPNASAPTAAPARIGPNPDGAQDAVEPAEWPWSRFSVPRRMKNLIASQVRTARNRSLRQRLL